MAQLAINGGEKVLKKPLSRVSNIGVEEEEAAVRVIRSGVLSDYVGVPGEFFLGGKEVRAFEQLMCETFKVKHAVSVNSATSALHSAIVALGIGPGDEVIVSPYTMSASATAILMNGAVPIFADIEEDTYCLDPKSVEERITARTKAIMVVNLFGGVARFDELKAVADKHSLRIIEDNAQSPGAIY
ncbi:MAG: aminotransferase class I/II-fold pyridoxal phosphate-dependent enzyme, partial [Patescibacteria group bacterium]